MYNFLIFIIFIFLSFNSFAVDIDETIKNTVKNNPKIKVGIEKLIESRELIERAYGARLPTLTSTITGTYLNSETTTLSKTTTPETFTDKYKLSLTQNIYDAGFKKLEIERSKILFENEVLNFNDNIQNLILEAINGYLTVINYEKSLEANKKNFESVTKALDEVRITYNSGTSTIYELQLSESLYAIASAKLFEAEQHLKISKKSFARISGIQPINLDEISNIDSEINIENIINNLNSNFKLKIIDNNVKNKEILLLKEKKSKYPNIDITGSTEYTDGGRIDKGTETTNNSIALTLTIPLYQQGIDNSDIRKYQSQILQAEINYKDLNEDLKIQAYNYFKDLEISKIKMDSNLVVIKASQTALKSLQQEYRLGTKTITEIIKEEENLLNVKVDYLNSKKDYYVSYFKIKSLDGSLLDIFTNYLPEIK